MEAFARSEDLQCEPSVTVKGQCDSEAIVSSPSVISENKEANTCELSLYDPNVAAVNILNLRSNELVEVPVAVAVTDSHHSHSLDTGTQDIQANNKAIGPSRSWEDGFNWRKYGQKHIKGNEFPRSYYKCSHPNCQVKKQVEQSHDGRITDVIYRGTHDHPKPQSVSHMAAPCTFSSGQGDKPSSGNGQVSHPAKPNDVPERSKPNETSERSYIVTSDKEVEGAELSRIRDEIQDSDDNPESKRRCLNFNTELTSDSAPNHERCRDVLEVNQGRSEAFTSSSSNENVTAADGSHEITLPVPAPHPPSDMAITSNALVPVGVDLDNLQQTQRSDIGVQTMLTDQKRSCPTVDRFWGDGYNWRKYGQKHIKGSEFPRSYYRCTHPNCQVKKQLGCSHDGQITDIVYKGEHNHPRPLPNSHIAVGRILSIQEEGFERVSSLNQTYDKSSTEQTTRHTELNGTPELYPVQKSETDGQNGSSKVNRTDNRVEQNADLYSNSGELIASKETGNAAAAELNHHQCKPSVEVEGQSQCQALVSSPSVTNKDTDISPRDLTPSAVSNSPVYMVTSRGIVPVEVDTEEKRQRASTANTVEVEESHSNGLSLPMTEKLLENAYHWRKYGQKNIKGSEFPRSYYRCTHPNCQVKMQMERSHDGRIIEIIYKGKHDHPKPQPITRMAIGAILSLEEDISDKISDDSCDKLSNGHVQTAVCTNPSPFPEYSPVTPSAEIVEAAGQKLSRSFSEIENYNDMESTKRRKDIGDMDFNPVIRTPREPRVVVETLSEVDVVDDGYRWQKYGRKIVKGNSHPRNYYRCSTGGCTVKKHVERAANNPKAVVTTYEGKHNHDLPRARITTHDIAGLAGKTNDSNDMLVARSGELFANGIDAGATGTSTPVHRMYEREERVDMDTIKNQSNNTDPDTSKVMEPVSVAANMCEREERVDMEIIKRQSNNTDPETSKVMEPVSVAANMYEREERVDMESIQSRSNITDPDSSKVMEAVSVAGNLYEREERVDMETSQSRPNIIDPDTEPVSVAAHNGDQNEDADQDRLDKNEGKSICLTPSLDHLANPKAENMES